MRRTACFLTMLLIGSGMILLAAEEDRYVPEKDPLAAKKIAAWQDLKLGLLMHWGPYSQWGVVESWSICAEDEDWCRRKTGNYDAYKREYEDLPGSFNPVRFDPERWARAARHAGMRYVVFTTKHHDGFCMFDTATTDYRITGPLCRFSQDPRADVTRLIFEAFRREGMMTGAYFSKPDWHSPDYWWPNFATPNRHSNYSLKKYPERWQRFVEFTQRQIDELVSNYGPLDILWLDGGWVRARTEDEIRQAWLASPPSGVLLQNEDIDMPRLVQNARRKQPGIIIVDRAVPGPFQNYLTPEARVPSAPLPHPWETCMPMATSWSYVPSDRYKTARELIHMLADVVAKGGNLLLNIGPGPDGEWHPEAYRRLEEIGRWMAVNGTAIYQTRPEAPYLRGDFRFTRGPDGTVNAIWLAPEGTTELPATLLVPGWQPAAGSTVRLAGSGEVLTWKNEKDGCRIAIPASTGGSRRDEPAWVFQWTPSSTGHPPQNK